MPGDSVSAFKTFSPPDVLTSTVLTFQDASTVRWIRMPDGGLLEADRPTMHESVLAVINSTSLPAPAERASVELSGIFAEHSQ